LKSFGIGELLVCDRGLNLLLICVGTTLCTCVSCCSQPI